ncbi:MULTISPECIES: dipeptide epimerase [unclassified Streptomyces]|uniref:dipeptide epimerase n=1 Tax=unclassified Streptomyces TaxID=2593676 RepID=UPI0008989DE2|nr:MULTISPECIES: dipeptide epimerase [unclassified Streptomyces]PBC80371.1 L-alanine-DL-glutamate epimerase-like enolase superfamily enzyme [Streptomyces sp. 2321.6]SEB72125.1 L-alanine-DL-glutamate epimerase [Streptomyces sp. 2133.1]SNC60091.1 L-alanine-DL-glutamate epimerase [Streptomyces sp. 2114.4]
MKASQRTVRLELTTPLRISRSTMAARDAVWLTIEHHGHHGYGEAVTSTYYGLDAATLARLLNGAARELARWADPESALAALRAGELPVPGTPAAVTAAVESALLDLVGKRAGVPVYRLLGSTGAPRAATARTIGITSPGAAAEQAGRLARQGFSVLKIKAGLPDPEDDLDRVRAVRRAAPDARLLLDPNGGWTPALAQALLPRYADLGVEAVEQPLAPGDPETLARLAERSPLPVIADEDAVGVEDARRLAGRVHGLNVKLAKCGGVTAALRIADLIAGSGTALMLGCLTASTLGLAPAVHLADRARWTDLDGHLLLAHDPWTGIGGTDGTVGAGGQPGLGVRPARGGPPPPGTPAEPARGVEAPR